MKSVVKTDKVYIRQTSRTPRSRTIKRTQESDFHGRREFFIKPTLYKKTIMILTLTASRSLTAVPNGQKY